MHIGRITALALRPSRAVAPQHVDNVDAIAGTGLKNDVHADPLSPRQVLLADAHVYQELALPPLALRENLQLDIDTAQLRSGTVLQIGQHAQLRLMFQCEACGQLDTYRQGLTRALGQRRGQRRGMLARVLSGGKIKTGDPVHDLGPLLPPWSDDWRVRIKSVLDAMPPGSVLEYAQLARLAGVQSTYCRAFPRMLAKLGPGYASRAVPRHALPAVPRWQGQGLFHQDSIHISSMS